MNEQHHFDTYLHHMATDAVGSTAYIESRGWVIIENNMVTVTPEGREAIVTLIQYLAKGFVVYCNEIGVDGLKVFQEIASEKGLLMKKIISIGGLIPCEVFAQPMVLPSLYTLLGRDICDSIVPTVN